MLVDALSHHTITTYFGNKQARVQHLQVMGDDIFYCYNKKRIKGF